MLNKWRYNFGLHCRYILYIWSTVWNFQFQIWTNSDPSWKSPSLVVQQSTPISTVYGRGPSLTLVRAKTGSCLQSMWPVWSEVRPKMTTLLGIQSCPLMMKTAKAVEELNRLPGFRRELIQKTLSLGPGLKGQRNLETCFLFICTLILKRTWHWMFNNPPIIVWFPFISVLLVNSSVITKVHQYHLCSEGCFILWREL